MPARKRVAKRGKVGKARASGRNKAPRALPDDLAKLYRPIKKPVTLRLDADIIAWFQRQGKGYQTRMNRALRKLMVEERRKTAR